MDSRGSRNGNDRSLAVKAHEHALAAIRFAKEHRYREAAEMHLTSGTYFKKLQTLLKQENEIDTATALGLLVHHHMFMQEEMNKQADHFEKLPEKQQQQRRSSTEPQETAVDLEKGLDDSTAGAKAEPKEENIHGARVASSQKSSLEQRQHNFSRKEVDQVVRDFDNITNMEDTLNRFPSRPQRLGAAKQRAKKMEESFFFVDDRDSKRYPSRTGSSRARLNTQEVARFEEAVQKMEDFKKEYRQKFFKLKRSLEEFKKICGVAFESRLRELHSTDTAALLERYQEEINELKLQLRQEKAKRIKVQSELDRYARHVAKSKRQQLR